MAERKIRLMVSSSVYGQEDLLDQVFAVLTTFGYEVWMSRKGTIPLRYGLSALENCLEAVRNADLFFAIINGHYGSGIAGARSITHDEICEAIKHGKPRFYVVHHDVNVARQILKQFRNDENGQPRPHTYFHKTPILDDARILEMLEAALELDVPLEDRKDNWVQEFREPLDVLRFVEAQFKDPERWKSILQDGSTGKPNA